MKNCEYCNKEFDVIRRHGGNNRTFCFDCIPEGLTKSERARKHQDIRGARSKAMKLKLGCYVCGYNRCSEALEWHHPTDDKLHDPSNAIKRSWEAYILEIKKCVLLCSNCHREVHSNIISL